MLASLLLPKQQEITLLSLGSLPAFSFFLTYAIETHILTTSGLGFTGIGKNNAFNIVQMKRNGTTCNCPT